MSAILLFIIFILLNILDIVTTVIALDNGLIERNLVLNYALKHLGIVGLIAVKTVIIIIMYINISVFSIQSLILLNIVYLLLIIYNLLKVHLI